MLDTLNNFDYIGVGIGLTAISVILGGAAYGICSLKFGGFLGESTAGRIAGATLLLSSLALGVITSAIGLITGDLPFKEFVGLSIAFGVMAYTFGKLTTWCSKIKCSSEGAAKLHRD